MKKIIQQYLMAIVAVMMVIGFSAFKVVDTLNDNPEYVSWYFTGEHEDDVIYPEFYSDEDPEICGEDDEVVCEIKAPEGLSGKPDLSAPSDPNNPSPSIQDRIEEAMTLPKSTNDVVISLREL